MYSNEAATPQALLRGIVMAGAFAFATALSATAAAQGEEGDDESSLDTFVLPEEETPEVDPPRREEARGDTVIVTGTRIRTPGLVSNSPITSVDQEEMNLRQPTAVEDFIKQLPSAVPAIGPGTNNGNNGGATIDLRGLGSERNLVLIDGRRLVPFNLDGQVDTNAIPVGMLERVDLVTGGASAVYGADAVSGVVNFILRRNFEGINITGSTGMSDRGDAERQRVDLTVGVNSGDGRGNLTLGLGYTQTEPLLQGDRPFGEETLFVNGDPIGSTASVPTVSVIPDQGTVQFDPATGEFVQNVDTFNFNPLNLFQAPLERTQFTMIGHQELTDRAELYGQLFFNSSDVGTQLAPSGTFFNNFDISVANPFLPDPARQQLCEASSTDINDCSENSDETITDVQLRRRFVELGPRLQVFENQSFQYTVGLRGDLMPNWDYDLYWSRGESDQTRLLGNWGSNSRVQQALLATEEDECLNTANGCVPLNLFGPAGSITQEMIDFFNLTALQQQEVVQEVGSFSVGGEIDAFGSPATNLPIGVAFGLEHRRVSAGNLSDDASQIQGEILGTGAPTPDRRGSFKLNEIYAEALVPLVNDRDFIRSLTFEAGARYTEFDVSGTQDYVSWKAGLAWEPIDEVRVRTMFQRATRAPNINELFQPEVTGLDNLAVDPCQGDRINQGDIGEEGTLTNLCVQTGVPEDRVGNVPEPAAGQINVLVGGNTELGPEKADTLTAGVVWQPSFVDRLTLTLDYYSIEIDEAISEPSSGDIIDGCYSVGNNPNREFNSFCANVGRSPTSGDLNAGDADGVALPTSNFGKNKTTGFDLGAFYDLPLPNPNLGSLNFALNLTHVTEWDFQSAPTSINRDCLGFYSVNCTENIYDTKANLRTTWSLLDYDVSLNWRYLSGIDLEPLARPDLEEAGLRDSFASIGTYNYFDLTGVWRPLPDYRLTLTINNLFDKQPPIVSNFIAGTSENSGNTFPQFYDTVGRYLTLGFSADF